MSWPYVFASLPTGDVPASYLDANFNAAAPLNSPNLVGTPTAPTQNANDNSTNIATTAYVDRTSGAKAWVNFTGGSSPTINGSFNVASVVHNGAGDYTITFSSSFADANYATVALCAGGNGVFSLLISQATTNTRIGSANTLSQAGQDASTYTVAVFGT